MVVARGMVVRGTVTMVQARGTVAAATTVTTAVVLAPHTFPPLGLLTLKTRGREAPQFLMQKAAAESVKNLSAIQVEDSGGSLPC